MNKYVSYNYFIKQQQELVIKAIVTKLLNQLHETVLNKIVILYYCDNI